MTQPSVSLEYEPASEPLRGVRGISEREIPTVLGGVDFVLINKYMHCAREHVYLAQCIYQLVLESLKAVSQFDPAVFSV